ncbi:hypothetical protein [Collimonas fungivorans]|jgi:hypothetical protein|uniref:Uncharacterized protein n=1 Tax=Collimonas fungivorans (strain Ter331) TaxID=1005048 RepID=G0ABQ3_COLFT|nr:hypothetical protein [Collimonas fungivorans]AEK61859.1 hypothetical protein CFU_2029 [Collimonas fungivorans Ter331]
MSETVYQQVQLQITNAQAGQNIWIDLQKVTEPVAWSTGPAFDGSGGINITVPGSSSALPLNSFIITASSVKVSTVSSGGGGGGGALSFNVTLYLVAQPGIQNFSLRSLSDPGVTVQAQVGFAQPQAVNQTFSQFPWGK